MENNIKTGNNIRNLVDKAHAYDDLLVTAKGFAYDSLCFRYKEAREKQAYYEAMYLAKDPNSKFFHDFQEAFNYTKRSAERDSLAFFRVLDQFIGEHDWYVIN